MVLRFTNKVEETTTSTERGNWCVADVAGHNTCALHQKSNKSPSPAQDNSLAPQLLQLVSHNFFENYNNKYSSLIVHIFSSK